MFNKIKTALLTLASISCLLPFCATRALTSTVPTINTMPMVKQKELYDQYPWAITYYYGITVTNPLLRIFKGEINRWPEHIQSIEVAHTLNEDNFLRCFFHPLVSVVQIVGNTTLRIGSNQNTIYEFAPYIAFRWIHFPWNNYVDTSLALGEGISYTTSVPAIERRYSQNTKRLLNYALFELTFAHPAYRQLQLVTLIHHRSGAYGLYHAGNSGSNDLSIGLRYLFN